MWRLLVLLGLVALSGCVARPAVQPAAPSTAPASRFGTIAEKRAAFAEAYDFYRHGNDARALPIFKSLAQQYPELADYHLYFTALIAVRLDRDDEAEAAFSQLVREYPDSVKALSAALELGKLFLRQDHVDQARRFLQSAVAAPDNVTAQGARLALAEADERDGSFRAAYAEFMQLRRDAIGSAVGRAAKEHVLVMRGAHTELTPARSEILDEAQLLLRERDYSAAFQAGEQLTQYSNVTQDAEEIGRAFLVMANAEQGLGQTEQALHILRDLADRFPATTAAPEGLSRYASILWNEDRDAAALSAFQEFSSRYPDDPKAPEALYAIGRIHQSEGRAELASRRFGELARRYPRSRLATEARWRVGWLHYLTRDWAGAAASFRHAAAAAPPGRARNEARYWQARALERNRQSEPAHNLYEEIMEREPNGYYAMWAERRLGLAPDLSARPEAVPDPAPLGPAPAAPAALSASDIFHLDRWQELRSAGVKALSRGELTAIEGSHRQHPAMLRFLLRAYQTVDGFASALRLLQRSRDVELPQEERDRLLYPLAFWTEVSREARANAIDPLLIEAVMRQESLFDPEVRSPANAWGLLQLLPETARRVARDNGSSERIDLTEPDINLQLGTRYFDMLLQRFGGDTLKAIAAYNGGEAAVEKWERRFPELEPDEFVESISFRETRDYVKRVVTNYRTYRRLYGAYRGAGDALIPLRLGLVALS